MRSVYPDLFIQRSYLVNRCSNMFLQYTYAFQPRGVPRQKAYKSIRRVCCPDHMSYNSTTHVL